MLIDGDGDSDTADETAVQDLIDDGACGHLDSWTCACEYADVDEDGDVDAADKTLVANNSCP